MRSTIFPAVLSLPLVLALTACGESDPESATESPERERTATQAAQPRVVVASDEGVTVVDANSLETIDSFATKSRPKLAVSGDDRHVFTMQYDAGVVGVVDSGSWTVAHGDHGHSYVTAPSQLKTDFPRGTSYHVVSDDERSVVWFDTDGSFQAFDWKGLEDDQVDLATIETKSPHHGVAAPLDGGGFLVSVANSEEEGAIGVAVLDDHGHEQQRIETCPGLHGEAHLGGDTYGFGCSTGMLVVSDGEGTNIASPRDGAGSGHLASADGSSIVVGDLGAEGDAAADTHLAFYDVKTGGAKQVDVGVEFSGLERDGVNTVVLGTDGALHVFDEQGKEMAHHEVVDPWTTFEDWQEPVPSFVVGDGIAYVTDPRDKSITAFDLTTGKERATGTLPDVPASLVVTNAG